MDINNQLSHSLLESQRFGFNIWRGNLSDIDEIMLKKLASDVKADIFIIRLPAENKSEHYRLHAVGGDLLHCDTVVHYFCSIASSATPPLRNALEFHLATEDTKHIIGALTEELFYGYQSHYLANPVLDKKLILKGYVEWSQSYINETDNNKFSWYITQKGEVVAFVSYQITSPERCEGILSAVKPAYAARGVYTDIMRFVKIFFRDMGIKIMVNSTQIQNYSVQKAWIKEGFTLKEAFDTYHINCFLTHQKPGS